MLVQGGGHAVKAGVQQRLERPELAAEPVETMDARRISGMGAAEGGTECGVLADQRDGAGPGRQRVDAPGEHHADHHANRVAGPTRPAGCRKLGHELVDLGAVEQRRNLYGIRARWYGLSGHGGHISLVQTPGGSRLAGVT